MNNTYSLEFGWCDLVGQPVWVNPEPRQFWQTPSLPGAIATELPRSRNAAHPSVNAITGIITAAWNGWSMRLLLTIVSLLTVSLGATPGVAAADSGVLEFDRLASAPSPVASDEPAIAENPAIAAPPTPPSPPASASDSPAISFNLPTATPVTAPTPAARSTPALTAPRDAASETLLDDLFKDGSNSLVARTVGHAEGTRTPDGSKTRAYEGHTDPGNGVWNLGSFSFQHCREAQYNCATPEQADVHQMQRLEGQAERLRQRATSLGLEMTLEEELNGIDLANQAPLAALGTPEAYPEHLARAKQMGLTGQDAILEGRVWSYWADGRWQAPGLGNTEANIRHDQNRRMQAIARALNVYQQQLAAGKLPHGKAEKVAASLHQEQMADLIIAQNL